MDETGRPYALVMQKGSVAPYALKPTVPSPLAARTDTSRAVLEPLRLAPGARPTRYDALKEVIARTPAGHNGRAGFDRILRPRALRDRLIDPTSCTWSARWAACRRWLSD